MTDKELLERLRAEVAAVTPDCWSGILARVHSPAQQPEEAPVVPMPERKRRSAWRGWVAAAAVFFLVILGGGLYATQVPGGVATLDANPSIELTVNKLGRVLSARACNPDAQLVLDGLELRNQSLQTAADAIVANMQANGYVSADANSILVTVEADKGDARLCGRLADAVESAQTDCGMESAVLAQVLEDDPALEAYASAVGVSAGKAMLIRQISAQVQDLTGSELVGLPINDLNILAASNQVELSGIESIGAASTGVYVPYDKALQAALTCCGLTTDDVTRASMRFTLIDGEMVMEFVLSDGERHYVCSVDAETTEVCRLTGDEPKRPEEAEIVPVSPVVRPNSPVTPAPTPMPTPMPAPAPAPTPTPTPARRPGHAGAGAEDRHCGGRYLGERPGRVGCSARREWCAAGLPRDAYDGVLLPPPLRRGCRSADRNGALGGTVRIIQATKRTPGRASFFAARRYGASLCRWGRGMHDFSS